eukprot:Lithocolla_globosa_v1_NODE_1052_length_2913_cov_5.370889.p2 type:complete len:129 gc:universal NODE_1052_length_2913_cov_5.370889:1615-1229(-)
MGFEASVVKVYKSHQPFLWEPEEEVSRDLVRSSLFSFLLLLQRGYEFTEGYHAVQEGGGERFCQFTEHVRGCFPVPGFLGVRVVLVGPYLLVVFDQLLFPGWVPVRRSRLPFSRLSCQSSHPVFDVAS